MENTNVSINGYNSMPLCDNHMHLVYDLPLGEVIDATKIISSHFNYDKIQICTLPHYNKTENYKGFYLKSIFSPSVYVSFGLDHHYDERDTSEYYLSEIKKYYEMGCDGIKIYEGKVQEYRKVGRKICDPVYDEFYRFAEEKKLPIVIHLGDPIEMWDLSKCSQYAIERGWYCSEEDPTRDELRQEIDELMNKFPKLHVIMAHFYFMGDELEKASTFLDKWENACLDLTPGGEMFVGFTNDYDKAYAFFEKYQDRIIFGTDTYLTSLSDNTPEKRYGARVNIVRAFLEKKEPFPFYQNKDIMLKPFGLPSEILEKIYRKNFIRLYGDKPRDLNYEKLAVGCRSLLSRAGFSEIDLENINKMIKHFDAKIK